MIHVSRQRKKMNIKLTSFEICEARVVYICHVIDKLKLSENKLDQDLRCLIPQNLYLGDAHIYNKPTTSCCNNSYCQYNNSYCRYIVVSLYCKLQEVINIYRTT